MKQTIDRSEFAKLIKESHSPFVLTSHKNPDGDGIGAMFAMAEALKILGKEVYQVLDEEIKPYYQNLEQHKFLSFSMPILSKQPIVMTFDCGSLDRVALPQGHNAGDFSILNIDHHLSNDLFGSWNLVEVDSVASCAVVYFLIRELDVPITRTMATALYTGLVYDTGRFAYIHSESAFELAADLMRLGADHWLVYSSLYRHNTMKDFQDRASLISSLESRYDKKLVFLSISQELTDRITMEEMEELINSVSDIQELEVVAFFRFVSEKETKISFRSRGTYSVCELAVELGGGGHRCASGAVMNLGLAETQNLVLEKLSKFFEPAHKLK